MGPSHAGLLGRLCGKRFIARERAGISRQTVIRVESEMNRRLDYDVLEKLAEAFAVDPAFLIASDSRKGR